MITASVGKWIFRIYDSPGKEVRGKQELGHADNNREITSTEIFFLTFVFLPNYDMIVCCSLIFYCMGKLAHFWDLTDNRWENRLAWAFFSVLLSLMLPAPDAPFITKLFLLDVSWGMLTCKEAGVSALTDFCLTDSCTTNWMSYWKTKVACKQNAQNKSILSSSKYDFYISSFGILI